MVANSTFRTLAFALRGSVSDTYDLLSAADAVSSLVDDLVAQGIEDARRESEDADYAARQERQTSEQNLVNLAATALPQALAYFNETRKVMAIKEVRLATGCGLKAAKDAVESRLFADAAEIHAKRLDDYRALVEFKRAKEWSDYHERMAEYCCYDCHGMRPAEPLAEWERELLTGE